MASPGMTLSWSQTKNEEQHNQAGPSDEFKFPQAENSFL